MTIVSIDIGSTWTKGARFRMDGNDLHCEQRAATPTTPRHLADGFFHVLQQLTRGVDAPRGAEIAYSSSAKGGLAVAAIGIVPEITVEVAKLTACSAGARLSRVLSYRLTRDDVRALEAAEPDVVLLTGGTDGGNSDYVLGNAEELARSSLACPIVYAGNRDLQDAVRRILAGRQVTVAANVLPEMEMPDPEPARSLIREIFLSTIAGGKGLDVIARETGCQALPTPYAVYEFTRTIRDTVPGWRDFMLIDLGGATTDVYSAHASCSAPGTVMRSLPEPDVRRTVEGDLGMRVSAVSAAQAALGLRPEGDSRALDAPALRAHAARMSATTDALPACTLDTALDQWLAGGCIAQACARHAGRAWSVCTPDGDVRVQVGRDLGGVRRVIGSGGWLARARGFDLPRWLAQVRVDERQRAVLLPQRVDYYRDADYLVPLLANVARLYPDAAARAAVQALVPHTSCRSLPWN